MSDLVRETATRGGRATPERAVWPEADRRSWAPSLRPARGRLASLVCEGSKTPCLRLCFSALMAKVKEEPRRCNKCGYQWWAVKAVKPPKLRWSDDTFTLLGSASARNVRLSHRKAEQMRE